MSQAPPGVIDSEAGVDPRTGEHQSSAPTQAPPGVSNFVDSSAPIFSMYVEMASDEDKKMAEGWKADADGILIFTGLFSAAVASLISVSIQDIRPNPQDTSNFYLANIYQTVSNPNGSNISSSFPSSPPAFSPPGYAVWVNSLWFLSLVISLTCALLATLLQQWARRYLKVTQPRYSPHKRARIRAFFAEGVEKFLLSQAVEVLPALLHISLFLFFAGLVVFLWNVQHTVFGLVLSLVGICTAVYGCITVMPLLFRDSPYYTPLTSLVWPIVIGTLDITFQVFQYLIWSDRFDSLKDNFHKMLLQGMQKTAEETAPNSPSEIDRRAFMWTLDSSDEDHELERFFSGLPGFRSSKVVSDPLPGLNEEQKVKLSTALMGLSDRTFSSNLLSDSAKSQRAIICAKAIDPTNSPMAFTILDRILSNYRNSDLLAAEIVQIVRGWGGNRAEDTNLVVRAATCGVVARAQQCDDSWFILASSAMGVPESDLRDYATHGDSLSLAILIHITRQQFEHFRTQSWPWEEFSNVLQAASRFNVQDALPELQHNFCALWDQIVLKTRKDNDRWMAFHTLRPVRNVFAALHQGTDSSPTRFSASTGDQDETLWRPSSYPSCNVAGHIHDDSASTNPRTILHDGAPPAPVPLVSPDPPASAPRRANTTLMDVLPSNNDRYIPGSFHPAHQTAIENLRTPAAFPDAVTARVIQGGIDTTTTMILRSTPEPLASIRPPTSITSSSTPGVVAVQNVTPHRTSLDVLDVPSPPFPTPVIDNMLPTGSHSPLLAPAAPGGSHSRQSSGPNLGAAAEGEGGAKDTLLKERDALDPPSAIRENIMTTPDLPPQLPSPLSVSDAAIAGPSWHSPGAEHTGDPLPRPSDGQYDIV